MTSMRMSVLGAESKGSDESKLELRGVCGGVECADVGCGVTWEAARAKEGGRAWPP